MNFNINGYTFFLSVKTGKRICAAYIENQLTGYTPFIIIDKKTIKEHKKCHFVIGTSHVVCLKRALFNQIDIMVYNNYGVQMFLFKTLKTMSLHDHPTH